MIVDVGDIHNAPPVIISVWDYDTFSADDLMGMCLAEVTFTQLSEASSKYEAPLPKWRTLSMSKDADDSFGEILVSFNLYDSLEMPPRNLV